ncbi:MAG: sigma-54-dependent transcriptional regulator [Roseiarcus sp.]
MAGPRSAHAFIASSETMRRVRRATALAAESDLPMLITGETGTGKEIVARRLHRENRRNRRRRRAFVVIDCAALSCAPREANPFDSTRGAFTRFAAERPSSFRDSDVGTLFFDNIDQLPRSAQARLARVLGRRSTAPSNGTAEWKNARVIAASRQDLAALTRDGRFFEDLYDHLRVSIELPPLRNRLNDILPLAEHFLEVAATGAPKGLSSEAAARLFDYGWPGNVRELKNAMERVTVLVEGDIVTAADLQFLGVTAPRSPPIDDWLAGDLPAAVARLETMLIRRALGACRGNRACAARRLNIHRQLLYQKLRRYGFIDESSDSG